MPELRDEDIRAGGCDLAPGESLDIEYNNDGKITKVTKHQKSDCYVITACYGKNSKELKYVKSQCKQLFVKDIFFFPFWVLYKYLIGEELAYLYSKNITKNAIKKFISKNILAYTYTKSYKNKFILIGMGILGFFGLPLFMLIKIIRYSEIFFLRKNSSNNLLNKHQI